MVNLPLLAVSALFFLGASAVFYLAAWACVTLALRYLPRVPARSAKAAIFAALIVPPVAAGALTMGGAFLRHLHVPGMEHHNTLCGNVFRFLTAPQGALPTIAGVIITVSAWLLFLWGVFLTLRLAYATVALKRGLAPYLQAPSPKLEAAVNRVRASYALREFSVNEANIPMAYSCLLGFRRVRCIVSSDLVASSTQEELEAVVTHEANHLRAGDVWRTLVVGVFNCLFFFLRPVRLLSRRWREATELACDAATVNTTRKPLALASAILRAQGVPVRSGSLPTTALAFAEEAACAPEKRVECLLAYAGQANAPAETRRSSAWQWAATASLAVLGGLALLSPQAMCAAHCGLEAIARHLH